MDPRVETLLKDIQPFSKIRVTTDAKVWEGILLPVADFIQLKLPSGYNVGIAPENVTKVEQLAPPEERPERSAKAETPSGKRVLVLLAGGTIASKVDYATGAVSASLEPGDILENYPELADIANVEVQFLANWMSGGMRLSHVNELAAALEPALNDPDILGVVVTHGTDTMHYTAAGLAFMFSHITKPVILTGSQRSSDRPSTDAKVNLCNAVFAAAAGADTGVPSRVMVCMHESIHTEHCVLHDGLACRKAHSSRRDAFESVNREPLARLEYTAQVIEPMGQVSAQNQPDGKVSFEPYKDVKVGMVWSRPNLSAEEIGFYNNYDGLILMGTGLGHLPVTPEMADENAALLKAVEDLASRIPVFMAKQTIHGITNLKVYSYGRNLAKAGVLGDDTDITPEAAYMKLAWLVSNHPDDARALMMENLKGEFSAVREIR